MTSKQEMATRARKKKRTVTTLAKTLKDQRKLSPTRKKSLAERQQQMRKQSLLKSRTKKAMALTPAQRKMMANMPKNKKSLTDAEKRKIRILKAKATTANAKASAARMDKKIAKIKKGK